jgi:Fe-S-cluster containining protein
MPSRPEDPSAELLAALDEVYRDAAELFAGWGCPSSTECCRFGITGREPYVTSIELAAVRRAIAARGGPRAWKRAKGASQDPAGLATGKIALPVVREERTCPMLTDRGRCAIYEARPLGCRTFYCDRATPGGKVKQRELNALVRQIQEIAARHEPGGDRGRPLTRAL